MCEIISSRSLVKARIISIFTSLIISIIEKGNMKSGLRYIPMFLASSVILYIIFSVALEYVMSSLVVI